MNQKKVPQLYVATGGLEVGQAQGVPLDDVGFQPDYHTEGVIYAKHILATMKDPKIGVPDAERRFRGKDY